MENQELIWVLMSVIGGLFAILMKTMHSIWKEKKEESTQRAKDTAMMTDALVSTKLAVENNSKVLENNTRAIDNLYNKITRATKK